MCSLYLVNYIFTHTTGLRQLLYYYIILCIRIMTSSTITTLYVLTISVLCIRTKAKSYTYFNIQPTQYFIVTTRRKIHHSNVTNYIFLSNQTSKVQSFVSKLSVSFNSNFDFANFNTNGSS